MQLQNNNPQIANNLQNLMNGNQNPKDIVQQTISGFTPQQKQALLNEARLLGVPNDIIQELQNMN